MMPPYIPDAMMSSLFFHAAFSPVAASLCRSYAAAAADAAAMLALLCRYAARLMMPFDIISLIAFRAAQCYALTRHADADVDAADMLLLRLRCFCRYAAAATPYATPCRHARWRAIHMPYRCLMASICHALRADGCMMPPPVVCRVCCHDGKRYMMPLPRYMPRYASLSRLAPASL